jgi:hypothetical protein
MESDEYEPVLRSEFSADEGSFLLQLRCDLTWDAAAFSRLIGAMEACAAVHADASTLPRWMAEGFWFCSWFVPEFSAHPNFPRKHPPAYYDAARERMHNLAYWFFVGTSPGEGPLPPL